jgi:alkyl sulfatase BDS1-like metallo-beta-lactamase superfamily hydrolase
MDFVCPDRRPLPMPEHGTCGAEDATRNLHDMVALRRAVLRDARGWATFLDDSAAPSTGDTDAAIGTLNR